jgi:putative restriction endonuclease
MAAGRRWTRDELLLALNLYRKLPFGQMHAKNPAIIALSQKLDRNPSSVGMKLCNFASLDPVLQARGIRGLQGASELDRIVWKEFSDATSDVVADSEQAMRNLFGAKEGDELEVVKTKGIRIRRSPALPEGPSERVASVKVRRSQQYFRQVILNAFDWKCCITGIPVPELLVASHIVPWSGFEKERINPQNGLCLSRLHDAAFDCGLITFDEERRLVLGKGLKSFLPHDALKQNFVAFEGNPFAEPSEAPAPDPEFLRFHRENVFRS